MDTNSKLLSPKVDVVFRSLFRIGNESITKALISDIIKQDIKSINLDNDRYLLTEYPDDKLGILDLKAILDNGTICNIEIQLANNHNTENRLLFYWSKLFSSQLFRSHTYNELEKTISIAILDYKLDKLIDSPDFYTKWKIINTKDGHTILTDSFELYILEIPKALEVLDNNIDDPIVQWLLFISDPNRTEVLDIMSKNEDIEEAMELLEEVSQDKKMRRLAELRQKAIWDEASAKESAIKHGLQEGMKKGMEQGLQQGIEQGIEQGIQQGIEQRNIEIAKNLLAKNIDISVIAEATGLSIEKIEELKS